MFVRGQLKRIMMSTSLPHQRACPAPHPHPTTSQPSPTPSLLNSCAPPRVALLARSCPAPNHVPPAFFLSLPRGRLLTAPPTTAGAWSAAAAHMQLAGVQCASSRDVQIQQFGQAFAKYISGQVFENEREWRSALLLFKQSVLESAEGSRCQKQAIYRQVESFLLDPTNQNVVAGKSGPKRQTAIADSLMNLLTDVSSRSSATCKVCNHSVGIIVQCSGRRCRSTFHTFLCSGNYALQEPSKPLLQMSFLCYTRSSWCCCI